MLKAQGVKLLSQKGKIATENQFFVGLFKKTVNRKIISLKGSQLQGFFREWLSVGQTIKFAMASLRAEFVYSWRDI